MRDWVNKFGVYAVVAVLVLAGAIYWFTRSRTVPPKQAKAFYVDEQTGDESVRPGTDVPPLLGKGGNPTVVEEVKFTCDGGATQTVGYLRKYTPEAKQALDEMYKTGKQPDMNPRENLLVRSPQAGSPWYSSQSEQGKSLMAFQCPDGKRAAAVMPPQ